MLSRFELLYSLASSISVLVERMLWISLALMVIFFFIFNALSTWLEVSSPIYSYSDLSIKEVLFISFVICESSYSNSLLLDLFFILIYFIFRLSIFIPLFFLWLQQTMLITWMMILHKKVGLYKPYSNQFSSCIRMSMIWNLKLMKNLLEHHLPMMKKY